MKDLLLDYDLKNPTANYVDVCIDIMFTSNERIFNKAFLN